MSADLLRRAASKAREVAEAATPGPWGVGNRLHVGSGIEQTSHASFTYEWLIAEVEADDYRDYGGPQGDDDFRFCPGSAEADAQHIALWHPGVALAVADWLDSEAEAVEWQLREEPTYQMRDNDEALTVARLLLGEAADV